MQQFVLGVASKARRTIDSQRQCVRLRCSATTLHCGEYLLFAVALARAGLICVRDESGPVTRDALASNLPTCVLTQIKSIAFDEPKCSIFNLLRVGPWPNLRMLTLDPFHLVINYLQSHNRKETAGSKFLRRIMNRWNKPLPPDVDIGPPFFWARGNTWARTAPKRP